MPTIDIREQFAIDFESALRNAGMARGRITGSIPTKPMYWRNQVKKTDEALYLLYSIMDSPETQAADNSTYTRTIYAYGTVFTRNGYSDENYQRLVSDIQIACKAISPKITFLLGVDGTDTSIDPESPIDYINFTAYQKRIQ